MPSSEEEKPQRVNLLSVNEYFRASVTTKEPFVSLILIGEKM